MVTASLDRERKVRYSLKVKAIQQKKKGGNPDRKSGVDKKEVPILFYTLIVASGDQNHGILGKRPLHLIYQDHE